MGCRYSTEMHELNPPLNNANNTPDYRVVHVRQEAYFQRPRTILYGRYMVCCVPFNSCFPQIVYTFRLYHQRYTWTCTMSFSELSSLLKSLRLNYSLRMAMSAEDIQVLRTGLSKSSYCCQNHNNEHFINTRADMMRKVLQKLVDIDACWKNSQVREFLSVSASSFNPAFGPKGLELWARKASGGFHAGYSRRWGDYITMKIWRWFIFYPNQIQWYQSNHNPVMKGVFHVNAGLKILLVWPYISIMNGTRSLRIRGRNVWETTKMYNSLITFYKAAVNAQLQVFASSFPVRSLTDCRVYTYSKDYFAAAALAMLGAKREIFIASWKNTPRVLLTRPPMPPIRLDQVLAFKAQQGVKVYIILYKEVEMSGQGNDSGLAMTYLTGLHPNIYVIRHPNKFVGGSTAVMWSHHEKLLCVDRNTAFVGGIDLAIGRWDDEDHTMVDPYGLKYPGHDYRQPAEKMHVPAIKSVAEARKAQKEVSAISGLIQGTKAAISDTFDRAVHAFEDVIHSGTGMVISSNSQESSPRAGTEIDNNANPDYEDMNDIQDVDIDGDAIGMEGGVKDELLLAQIRGSIMADPLSNEDEGDMPNLRSEARDANRSRSDSMRSQASTTSNISVGVVGSNKSGTALTPTQLKQFQCRDLYPRTGWHDVQCCISGVAARDVAAHFSERWNHHRLSVGDYHAPYLPFMTCETNWGICARCKRTGIFESAERCPDCDILLGPTASVLQTAHYTQLPAPIDNSTKPRLTSSLNDALIATEAHNFIEYEYIYSINGSEEHSGYNLLDMRGDCPVVVAGIRAAKAVSALSKISEGQGDSGGGQISESGSGSAENVKDCTNNGSSSGLKNDSPSPSPASNYLSDAPHASNLHPANLLRSYGNATKSSILISCGLYPQPGDVISTVDGRVVSHVNSVQLQRYIHLVKSQKLSDARGRASAELGSDSPNSSPSPSSSSNNQASSTIAFTFRRHYSEGIHPGLTESPLPAVVAVAVPPPTTEGNVAYAGFQLEDTGVGQAEESENPLLAPLTHRSSSSALPRTYLSAAIVAVKQDWVYENKDSINFFQSAGNSLFGTQSSKLTSSRAVNILNVSRCRLAASLEISYNASLIFHDEDRAEERALNEKRFKKELNQTTALAQATHTHVDGEQIPVAQLVAVNESGDHAVGEELHSASSTTTAKAKGDNNAHSSSSVDTETLKSVLPSNVSDHGTCCIQVLRSVGTWSIGKAVSECSIQNAWCDAISMAKHFVYIENQFFIGSTGMRAGQPAKNRIPEALLNRLVQAAQNKEKFKAIVVIPQHPQGDVAFSARPQIILHYQCETINKGPNSIISRFQRMCPGVNPFEYIGFYCLHNYGVLKNKFVHDQVYLHDKLICVDDRVLIIGSANVNDRSMVGERDSEVAVRIEDTQHLTISMAGSKFTAGALPHKVRCQLMKQHMGAYNGSNHIDQSWDPNVEDPISPEVYDLTWRVTASCNANHYATIDGARDVYSPRNRRIGPYQKALQEYENPHVLDDRVLRATDTQNGGIRGTLIPWPLDFLKEENLAPSGGMSLIPTSLWV